MALNPPYDHPWPERCTGTGGRVGLRLDRALTDGLGALAAAPAVGACRDSGRDETGFV